MPSSELRHKVNIGILGAGKMAYWHLRAYRSNPKCKVMAICNPSSDKGRILARKFSIQHCLKNEDDLLSLPGLDGIDISVPTGLHAGLIYKALKRGINVYTEKPMCRNMEEAARIVELNKTAKKIIFVGFNLRFCREFIRVKEILDSGELGEVKFIVIKRGASVNPDSYIFNPAFNAGIITELSSHALDLLRWWGFKDVKQVYAEGTNVFSQHPKPDSVCLNLKFNNGVSAAVINSYAMPSVSTEIMIMGSSKMLCLKYGKVIIQRLPSKWSIPLMLWITFKQAVVFPYRILYNPLAGACNHFVDCLYKNEPSELNEIEGMENIRLASLLNESYIKGDVIKAGL